MYSKIEGEIFTEFVFILIMKNWTGLDGTDSLAVALSLFQFNYFFSLNLDENYSYYKGF